MDMQDHQDDEMINEEGDTGDECSNKDQSQDQPVPRRACDPCRARKVGCDREEPCSSCIRSRTKCTYTASQSIRHKRQRVLISTQYERKIDRIEERLSEVVNELRNLAVAQNNSSSSNNHASRPHDRSASQPADKVGFCMSTPTSNSGVSYYNTTNNPEPPLPKFEGGSSMTAHTNFARTFLDEAVRAGPLKDFRLELDDTLSSLQELVKAQQTQLNAPTSPIEASATSLTSASTHERPLPDVQLTMTCLRISKEGFSVSYLSLCGMISPSVYTDYVLRVMFSPKFSDAEYIIVLWGLTWLFKEMSLEVDKLEHGLRPEDLDREATNCRNHLEAALAALPFHMPASIDNVIALGLAADYSIARSKPSQAWSFISVAAQMCLHLGLHRGATWRDESATLRNQNAWLFWNVYVLDKGLSLRLGRPSVIQDYDITVPIPTASIDRHPAIEHCLLTWIKVSRCQGRVYELLYSPAALAQDDGIRMARAQALADELLNIMKEKKKTEEQNLPTWTKTIALEDIQYIADSDEVLHHSILTLIYRAVPVPRGSSSTFTQACITSARQALGKHDSCMAILTPYGSPFIDIYFQWTIFYTPFIPFIVIFCHVIETTDQTDLDRLHSFVASLEPVSQLSEPAARMQRLFQVLYNVALKYVEVKTSREQQSVGRELDTYLNALGYGPAPTYGLGINGDGANGNGNGGNGGGGGGGNGGFRSDMSDAGSSGHHAAQAQAQAQAHQRARSVSSARMNTPGIITGPHAMPAPPWAGYQAMDGVSLPQQGMLLGGWFNSSQQMMGLLEDETL
ncbi:fungal specific transcription factor [Apiospora arundinis]